MADADGFTDALTSEAAEMEANWLIGWLSCPLASRYDGANNHGRHMMSEGRFIYDKAEVAPGLLSMMTSRILTDTVTGVQYLFVDGGSGGGITPLIDKNGDPLLSEDERVLR